MISYELRNVTGNPFVHIFGIGLPIFFLFIITRMTVSELQDASLIKTVSTTVFLGIRIGNYQCHKVSMSWHLLSDRWTGWGAGCSRVLCGRGYVYHIPAGKGIWQTDF